MTGTQLPLIDIEKIEQIRYGRHESCQSRFERFHKANPAVYRALRDMALWALRHGKRVGFRMLWEQLRWSGLKTNDEPYRLNNNYVPYYTRLLMESEPELDGYFQTRGEL